MAIRNITNNYSDKCTITPSEINTSTPPNIIVITANNGYKFSDLYDNGLSSPMVNFNSRDGDFTTNDPSLFSVTLSADKKTLTFTPNYDGIDYLSGCTGAEIFVDSNHPILIDDTPTNPILTLNKNLTNVTMSPDVTSIEIDGTSKVITLSVNQGYQLSGIRKLTISGTDHNFTLSNNVYTLDVNTIGISADVSGTITATATQITVNPILTLTKNLTNVTMSPDVTSIEIDGTSKVITLTADKGYPFSGTPKLTISGNDYNFNLSSDNTYRLDVNTIGISANVSGTITAMAIPRSKNVTNSLTNCTITPPFTSIVENETYNLTLNANQGCKFVTTPTLSMNDREGIILDFIKVTDYQYTLSFTAESGYFNTIDDAILSGVAVEETPIVNKYGAIQVYKPTNNDMSELATKRFRANNTVDGITYSDIDLGTYITQFKRIFFDVVTTSKSNILLGVHDTLINTDVVNNDDVTIDCGTVLIEGANGNELDTKIYKIKIVLPFYEVVELPSIYMNKTIHIVYKCNVITGYADILINEVVSNTDLLIVKYRCKISQDLPYILDYDKLNGGLSDMQLNTSPKIILQKNNTFIDKGYSTYKKGLISNEVGYFEVKDIVSMSLNATQKEKDLIENLLKSGVYI